MTKIELDEKDLRLELFLASESEPTTAAELAAIYTEAPIKVTHLPTGISAIGEGQGNQVKNKARAIELLKEQLARNGQSR